MRLPDSYNYIAAFITMRCCYSCSYCINWKSYYSEVSGSQWVKAFSSIETDLPVTLCGGEPSLHPDFYKILNEIPQQVDLLTNLQFDVQEFINQADVKKFDDSKLFAPIRVSFHAQFMDVDETLAKVYKLGSNGYRVGLYCVDCKVNQQAIGYFSKISWLDFQVKPLLDNKVLERQSKRVKCRIRELLVAPNLNVHRCHRDLYKQQNPIGILDSLQSIDYLYRPCLNGNDCHPCDTKIKRDRFGASGYRSIEVV